jgi:UDP-N-acetylmuramyl pentapeptide synthase
VAVLGDMLELGDESRRAHEALGQRAAALGIPVIALGEMAGVLAGAVRAAGGSAEVASDVADAARRALAGAAEGDWLLLKASRALRLERVFEALERSEPSRASPA